ARSGRGKIAPSALAVPKTYAVLGATNEQNTSGGYTTFLGVTAAGAAADLTFSYLSGGQVSKVAAHVTVPAGKSIDFSNIFDQIFGIPLTRKSAGTILIDTTSPVEIYGRIILTPQFGPFSTVGNLPVVSTASEALTSAVAGYQRPIYFDGLEQSIDPTRGSRWSVSPTELYNLPATVTVRLYEAGNRTAPIAETDVALAPHEQKILDPVF